MNATITGIDNLKMGNGTDFKRVYFKTDAGDWAKTDLCPDYNNYRRWKPLLEIGNHLGNLMMRNKTTVEADSFPRLLGKPGIQLDLFSPGK